MAIQISGTTVIDDSRNITNGGSGSFSSTVTVATPTSSNHATTKTYVDDAFDAVAGKILQVQQSFTTSQSYSTTSRTWAQMSALNRSITTTQTNSKILLIGMVSGGLNGGSSGAGIYAFTKGGSRIGTGTPSGSVSGSGGGIHCSENYMVNHWFANYLDSPGVSSGTSLTYGIQFANAYNTGDTLYINRSGNNADQAWDANGSSTLVVMEIAP